MPSIQAITLLALILRLILANQSFWLDEGASLIIARQDLSHLLGSLAGDFHPPLFYLMLHGILTLGVTNEILLRLPNILFGTATVYLVYRLVKQINPQTNIKVAALAALLLAINPLHIYYSQELRMYALSAFLSTLSWLVLMGKQKRKWPLFAIVTALNIYTFYGAFFNFLAQIVYEFIHNRSVLKKHLGWWILPLVLFVPWLPTLRQQLMGSEILKSVLPGWSALSGNLTLKSLALIPVKFVLGRINLADSLGLKITGILATIYLLSLMSFARKGARLFGFWLFVPLLLAIVLSLWSPLLGYWRFIYLVSPAVCLVALGLERLKPPYRLINTAMVVLIFLAANIVFWTTPHYQRENWKGLVEFDSHFNRASTLYVFAFSDAFAPFKWYLPEAQYIAPLKELRSDPNKLDSVLSSAIQGKNTILYFEYLEALTDPEQNIRHWFANAGYTLDKTYNFEGVGLIHEFHPQLIY
jgi:uncharacterized membrane protein